MEIILNDLTDIQLDALKEVTHIGAANAVNSLSQFINKTVEMSPPDIVRFNSEQIPQLTSKEIPVSTVISLEILSNISSKIIIVFDGKSALFLASLLMGKEFFSGAGLCEIDISAIKEVATVMAGSYLKSLGEMVNTTFKMNPPSFEYSGSKNILDLVNRYCPDKEEAPICFRSNLLIKAGEVRLCGFMLLVPSASSLQNLALAIMPKGS